MSDFERKVREQIARSEGTRSLMYFDSLGVPTIGVGHNLRDVPISAAAIDQILRDDLAPAFVDCQNFTWWSLLNEPRKAVMVDMRFNLGAAGFRQFKTMMAALSRSEWDVAADAMMASRWIQQVGQRAVRNVQQMRSGEWV